MLDVTLQQGFAPILAKTQVDIVDEPILMTPEFWNRWKLAFGRSGANLGNPIGDYNNYMTIMSITAHLNGTFSAKGAF